VSDNVQYFFRLIFFLLLVFLKRKLLPDRCFGAGTVVSALRASAAFGAVSAAAGAEPDGLAAAVSIRQTTVYCYCISFFSLVIPLAGNSRVALSESTSAIACLST
jgi:hypothetical protein